MHTALLRQPLSALLAVAALVLALACFAPTGAHALSDKYSCKSCASENGAEGTDNITNTFNTQDINESGKGVCAAIWRNEGGGKWHEYLSCTSAGTVDELKIAEYFTGHGEVRRYYKEYLYNLSGFEYNYST